MTVVFVLGVYLGYGELLSKLNFLLKGGRHMPGLEDLANMFRIV